jgi:Na+/H+ antiporter NhaD/arsenite permease-like protein
MFLAGLPRLKLDRSGVALLGAVAVMALTGQSVDDAARAVDLPTIVLLFDVDWRLLLLFIGLFVVNHAFESTVLAAEAVARFAGNLLLVGSIANLIVVDLARKSGIAIDWRQHAVTGIPVTIGTLALAWAWLRWAA